MKAKQHRFAKNAWLVLVLIFQAVSLISLLFIFWEMKGSVGGFQLGKKLLGTALLTCFGFVHSMVAMVKMLLGQRTKCAKPFVESALVLGMAMFFSLFLAGPFKVDFRTPIGLSAIVMLLVALVFRTEERRAKDNRRPRQRSLM